MYILDDKSPLDVFCEASNILNNAVEHTLGPTGMNTALHTREGHYNIINDGKSIIQELTSLDPAVAPAMETLKQSSFETNRKAGDGTTSTIIMLNKLLNGAKNLLERESVSPIYLSKELVKNRDSLLDVIKNELRIELSEDDYEKVCTVALGGDTYSKLVSDCFRFLNKGQRPALVKSDIDGVEVEQVDGLSLDKINIPHSMFLNNSNEIKDAQIICVFDQIDRFQNIMPLMKAVIKSNKKTVLFYNELSRDVLENLLLNYTQGICNMVPVRLGGYGKDTYKVMKTITEYSDGIFFDGNSLKLTQLSQVNFSQEINPNYLLLNNSSVIIKTDKEISIEEDLRLNTKSVIIKVGGSNKVEREEIYRRIEDAICSLGNAIEFGVVKGAGKTYIEAMNCLDKDSMVLYYVQEALESIYNTVLKNMGVDSLSDKDLEYVFDSEKVAEEVIKNSFTVAAQVLTTNRLIHDNIR